MLLITVALVLIGIVLLVIGIITQTTALLLVSIACAVVAGVTLLVQSRLSRQAAPTGAGVAAGPPPPPSRPAPLPPRPVPEPAEPATARLERVGAPEPGAGAEGAEAEAPPPPPPPPPPPRIEEPVPAGPVGADEDVEFPIADYDDLRVSEILPLLPELELDELDVVREREQRGKNRSVVIDRIDDLIDELEAEEEEVVVGADRFPIEDYDALSAEQILPLLPELDDDELDAVYEREERGQNRAVILDAIDDMFEEEEVVVEAEPAVLAPVKAPPKKAAAVKKVSVKKASVKSVKKVGRPKKAAAVKKVSAKKVGRPKKAAAVKEPVVKKVGRPKKAAVKKVSVKAVKKAAKAAKKR